MKEKFTPLGNILVYDFLIAKLSIDTEIPQETLESLIHGNVPMSDYMAGHLGSFFNTSKEFWLNLDKIRR